MGFSFTWISIRTRGLIIVKGVCKLAKYISQLLISIITLIEFWPWASKISKSIRCQISNRISSRSILSIRIIIHRNNTWAIDRQNCLARLNSMRRRPQRWLVSLMNLFWALWGIWQICKIIAKTWNSIEEYSK